MLGSLMMNGEKQKLLRDYALAFEEMRLRVLEEFIFKSSFDEEYSLSLAEFLSPAKQKLLIKTAYDHCKWLGSKIRNNFNESFSIDEIAEILALSRIPCIRGQWQAGEPDYSLTNQQCLFRPNQLKCRFWAKAINGMATGLNSSVCYARYENLENTSCTSILYGPGYVDNRWKHVPVYILEKVAPLKKLIEKLGIRIIFDGYAEGILYYHVEENGKPVPETFITRLIINTTLKLYKLKGGEIEFLEIEKFQK
jgi:hypothetical protein